MFGSNVLEVGIGIALLFLFVSLICTSFQEGIEMILKSRASDLERGIRLLLHDPQGGAAAKTFFEHPLIYSLFKGQYQPGSLVADGKGGLVMPRAQRANLPSYIPAANFSAALIDLVASGKLSGGGGSGATGAKPLPGDLEGWRKAASAIRNPQIQDAVRAAFELGGGDVDAARANLETWYNGTMDRVSGWYKRRAQSSLFLVGLFIAATLNIETITVIRELSVNADLRKAALLAAEETIKSPPAEVLPPEEAENEPDAQPDPAVATEAAADPTPVPAADETKDTGSPNDAAEGAESVAAASDYDRARDVIRDVGYPVGWSPIPQLRSCSGGDEHSGVLARCTRWQLVLGVGSAVAGWLATALAVMLGAPFWFDVLNKFMVIRSTVKSYEKSPPEGSEDRRPAQPAVAAPKARGMP